MRTPLGFALACFSISLASVCHAGEPKEKPDFTKDPPGLKFTLDLPKDPPTLADVNRNKYQIQLTVENTGKEDVVLWPYLVAELGGPDGKPVELSRSIGRWGVIKGPSIIQEIKFVTLTPGKSHTWTFSLGGFSWDADRIMGWKLAAAGEYTLIVNHVYERAKAKKAYGRGAADLDGEKQPWNQAQETSRKLEAKFTVKE